MESTNVTSMWEEYTLTKNRNIRENLILQYIWLVKFVAFKIYCCIGNNIEYDDMIENGYLGLIDAIDRFDSSKGFKFETYARIRIRGAIMDGIREYDYLKSSTRRKIKLIKKKYMSLGYKVGDYNHDKEVAQSIGISLEKLKQLQNYNIAPISLEKVLEEGLEHNTKDFNFENVENKVLEKDLIDALNKAINKLSYRDKKILKLHYLKGFSFSKIGKIMKVNPSYIAHVHNMAVKRLSRIMYRYNSSTML